MSQKGFLMYLKPGVEKEYTKRHDTLWPELESLLKSYGIAKYSIFLDVDTNILFGCLHCPAAFDEAALAQEEIMQKWWNSMAELMETEPNNAPKTKDLKQVFYLE
jgi:L-rhamnose mutarotase